jgi:hypothetical protein
MTILDSQPLALMEVCVTATFQFFNRTPGPEILHKWYAFLLLAFDI